MGALLRSAVFVSVLAASPAGCATSNTQHDSSPGTLVTERDLQQYPGEPLERVLERKVPGLEVRRTADGGFALRIRGAASFDGTDRSPLYVINGLPIQAGHDGAVPNLNPYDLESIRVLKGSEAAVYGIQGANGVILITTRKPGS